MTAVSTEEEQIPASKLDAGGSRLAQWLPLVAALTLFLGLAFWLAATKAPWCDEGWFANPSYNLAFKGKMSTNILEPSGHFLNAYMSGIQERTYVVVPNHLVTLALWFRAVGFSMLSMRALSICFGAIQILLVYFILRKLFTDIRVAQVAVLLLSIDFVYLWTTADGRMEAAATTLGIGCIAAWLHWRDSNITTAVFLSQLLGAAAVFTHPNALLGVLATVILALRYDRTRLKWSHIFLSAIPYCLFLAAWSTYIMESPGDFKAQFFANAAGRGSSRWKTILQPWLAVWQESMRHLSVYSASNLWAATMKGWFLFIPVLYVIALIRMRKSGPSVFLTVTFTYMAGMTFLNGFKAPCYFIYLLPWYNTAFAVWLIDRWRGSSSYDKLVGATLAGIFVVLQLSTTIQHIQADEYSVYESAIADMRRYKQQAKSITATAAMGADLDFTGFRDDTRLGMFTGAKSDVVLFDRSYRAFTRLFAKEEPAVFKHVATTLLSQYQAVAFRGPFWFFERRTGPPANIAEHLRQIELQDEEGRADYLFNALADTVPPQARSGSTLP